jgi:Gti1/Pac2 family transcription factor
VTTVLSCLTFTYAAAYFSQQKLDSLATVDTIHGIGDVPVPDGLFRSGRAGKSRLGRDGDSSRIIGLPSMDGSTGIQDPPSFSAFYSKTPDAAIRRFHLRWCSITQPHYCLLIEYLYPTPGSYLPSPSQIMNTKAATGVRRHPSKAPGIAGSSHTREQYREQAAFPSNSPSPSDQTDSDSQSSSPSPSTTPTHLATSQLVPLEYLQNITSPRREPADEQLLRRFSTHSISPAVAPRCGQSSTPPTCAQPPALPSDQPTTRHTKTRYLVSWDTNTKSR